MIVLGDSCQDIYFHCTSERFSAEAPVPILKVEKKETLLGMSANVAENIRALGVEAELLTVNSHFGFYDPSRQDTEKHRYVVRGQQMMRIDYEDTHPIAASLEDAISDRIEKLKPNIMVLQDYGKGVVTARTLSAALENSQKLLIDPSSIRTASFYGSAPYAIFPNLKEARALIGDRGNSTPEHMAWEIQNRTGAINVVLKMSEYGMLHLYNGKFKHYPTLATSVVDVTGAGDTVIAVVAAALEKGHSMRNALVYANRAASLAVGVRGNAVITWDQIC